MFAKTLTVALASSALFASVTLAQTPSTSTSPSATATGTTISSSQLQGDWRASKVVGLNVYNDNNGLNPTSKPIDQSIQPGDGGWGAQLELQGFTRVGPAFVFGSANYLLNPKDINDAPSGRAAGL